MWFIQFVSKALSTGHSGSYSHTTLPGEAGNAQYCQGGFYFSRSILKRYKWEHSQHLVSTRSFLLFLIWRWWRRTRRRRCSGMVLPQNRSPQQLSRYSAILDALVSRLYWLNGCHRLVFYVVNIDFCVSLACKLWKWLCRKEAWSLGRLQRQRFWWG